MISLGVATLDNKVKQLLHKWPKGLKKKLAEFYDVFNNGNIQCCLCYSTNNVAIHHYRKHRHNYCSHFRENGEIDWDDLSKYILLCSSCHGKIHHAVYREIEGKKVPFMEMLYQYMEEKHEKGWWQRG